MSFSASSTLTKAADIPVQASNSTQRTKILFYLGLTLTALAAFCLYLGNLKAYFLSDDFLFLNQLHFTQHNFTDSFVYFTRDWGMGLNFYRPFTRVIWAAEYLLFGEHPAKWHLVEMLLYAANAALVYLLAYLLSKRASVGWLAGLLFAFHPAHVETVTWIADETDLWATLFCLSATVFYILFRQKNSRSRFVYYSLSIVCFVLGLLNKESAAGFFVVPLIYDLLFGYFWQTGLWRWLRSAKWLKVAAWNAPFWVILGLYVLLRLRLFGGVGGYNYSADVWTFNLSNFIDSYTRWLIEPLNLSHTKWRLLMIATVVVLAATMVIWELVQAKEKKLDNSAEVALSFRSSRTAVFGLLWTILFLLPAITTPPSIRFVYLATIGVTLIAGPLLAPVDWYNSARKFGGKLLERVMWLYELPATSVIKGLAVVALLILATTATFATQAEWLQSSNQITPTVINGLKKNVSDLPNYSQIYVAGLPSWTDDSPPPLQVGFNEAVQLAYNNNTIHTFFVVKFPVVEQHLNQGYFAQYKDGQLIWRNDILQALQDRNAKIKDKKTVPVTNWDFSTAHTANSWNLLNGNGSVQVDSNAKVLQVNAPQGGFVQTPEFRVAAPDLANFQITIKANAPNSSSKSAELVVHWLVSAPTNSVERSNAAFFSPVIEHASGNIERTSEPLDIQLDGQSHIYTIKPLDITAFNYDDVISEIQLQLPSGLSDLQIEQAQVNSLP